tara:strand:- start:502 stop:771 length:270 start_codon:yes stop_codon:yes gene_type:complete
MKKDEISIKDKVDAILNPVTNREPKIEKQENVSWGEFSLKQEVLPEGSAIVDETISEVSIIDLKGKHFKFPGEFQMIREGSKITFKSIG